MDLKEIGCDVVDWMDLVQDKNLLSLYIVRNENLLITLLNYLELY